MKSKRFKSGAILFTLLAGGCSIKVYQVDQQTVLEEEAAGEWPEFEKEILKKTQTSVPTPFPTVAASVRKGRLLNVLNTVSKDSPKAAATAAPGKTQ